MNQAQVNGELLEATGAVGEIVDLVKQHIAADLVELEAPNGRKANVLILPGSDGGLQAHSIKRFVDEFATAPERREGTAQLNDVASFVAHANRFKDQNSALFASSSENKPTLTSVLDYHEAVLGGGVAVIDNGEVVGSTPVIAGRPRFGKHRGVYSFPFSEEWKAWTGKNKATMSQAAFAEFLEDRILDVLDPGAATKSESIKTLTETIGCALASPAKLLELSRGLTVHMNSKATNAANLSTGEANIVYQTSHTNETGGALKVPGAFLIGIPIFENGALYQIPVRLRYRMRDGAVTWFYELYRPERSFKHAFEEACELAKTGTGLPLFLGSPE